MIGKPNRFALVALALACAALLAACSDSTPVLRFLTIAPTSGTIYVSATPVGGVKAARHVARPAARNSRRAAVSPQDITTAVCGSLQYSATGYFSNGTTSDQSSNVTWSSSSTSVATVNSTGLASGVALGNTNIGATLANISATTSPLEVDQLNTITVSPANPNIANGSSQAFTATGNFTLAAGGMANQDITSQVTWASSNASVATIDSTGNATSTGQGTTTITATSCDNVIVGQTVLTVGAATGASLQITPAGLTAATGTTVQYTAVILNTDNSTSPLPAGTVLSWTSSTNNANINATTGLAQAVSAGTPTITATATSPASIAGFTGNTTLTVQAAAARYAYVANIAGLGGSGSISSYTVSPTSTSTPLGTAPLANTAAASPEQVLLHPSGDLLFYINSNGFLYSDFVNSSTGALTANSLLPVQASSDASGAFYVGAIDPTGRFLYVVTLQSNELYGFTITHTQPSQQPGDGTLKSITGLSGFTDGGKLNGPSWILIDSTGSYLYIVNSGDNTVREYSIDQSTGALTSLATASIPTGALPAYGTISANGHLYVANETDKTVSAYNITSNGQLSSVGADTPITGAVDTFNVITDPGSKYLYVLDVGPNGTGTGQVFAYNLDPTSGAITTQIGTTAVPTDVNPTGIAIDPTGSLLAVDNFTDGASAGDISTFTVGSNGALTPTSQATVPADIKTEFVVFYTAASGQ